MKDFRFVDLFCGGGGSISGAINALKKAGQKYDGRGFNHWEIAIRTLQQNHPEIVPDFQKACAPIESVLPDEIFNSDPMRIDVVWASPSCTHHSNAAGGKPRSNQLRSQPEYLLPYLRLTKCLRMFIENVKELRNWGPILDKDTFYKGRKYKAGQADPRKAGLFFNLWYKEIKASGYGIDMQIMNAADYGAATSRERLIIQCVRKSAGEKIIWPEPTHAKEQNLFGLKPWRSAAEIIDWSIPGESIFSRKKPLCENTLRRIESGIRKYWGAWAEPFLIILRGTSDQAINSTAIPLTQPLPTITAEGAHIALIQPVFMDQSHPGENADAARCKTGPLGTITTTNNWSMIYPFLTRYNGGEDRNHKISEPFPVIDCSNRYSVIQPFISAYYTPGTTTPTERPLPTITTMDRFDLVQPLFIPQQSDGTVKPIKNPLSTLATSGAIGFVEPFLMEYYGNGDSHPVSESVPTICTHDRFGLIQGRILTLPDGRKYQLDITHRMLTSRELADATGFSHDYVFAGSDTDAKKQIGNAVCPNLAEALYSAILSA